MECKRRQGDCRHTAQLTQHSAPLRLPCWDNADFVWCKEAQLTVILLYLASNRSRDGHVTNERPAGRLPEKTFPVINTALPEGPLPSSAGSEVTLWWSQRAGQGNFRLLCSIGSWNNFGIAYLFTLLCGVKCPLFRPSIWLFVGKKMTQTQSDQRGLSWREEGGRNGRLRGGVCLNAASDVFIRHGNSCILG